MSELKEPEVDAHGHVRSPFLIPLWTWLAILTLTVAVFFHGASQGAPWQVSFGATLTDTDKVRGNLAGLWGVPFLGFTALALYLLTLQWMRRHFAGPEPLRGFWERLPAPVFWLLPSTDPVGRSLRTGVWVLVFLLAPFSLGHLARQHFQNSIYELCADVKEDGCTLMREGPAPKDGAADTRKQRPFRQFATGGNWQRFRDHISARYLSTEGFWDHHFYVGGPSYLTYFPGPQAWAYLLLIAAVFWTWLRIMLSALFGRVVLRSPWKIVTGLPRITLAILLGRLKLWSPRSPARPPLALGPAMLRVGVIGHRKLNPTQTQIVQPRLAEVLAACNRSGYGLRIVSGMAAGADRAAVDWALQRPEVELLAILPSEASAFRDGSWVQDPDAFDRQIIDIEAKPNAALLVLPGTMPRDRSAAVQDPHWRAARIAAHRYKIAVLLRQCEFLVAAMDLSDPGKPGGTRECVEEALALGTPVLVLDIVSGQLGLITRVDQLRPGGLPQTGLQAFVEAISSQLPDLASDGSFKDAGTLARVYETARPSSLSVLRIWWTHFEAWCGGAATAKPGSAPKPAGSAGTRPSVVSAAPVAKPEPPPVVDVAQIRRRIADDQGDLMASYRGGYVLAYLLGLVAVTLALIIVLVLWLSDGQAKWTMLGLTCIKLAAVWGIACIIQRSEHERLSETAVALRYISERLRIMPTLALLGSSRLDLLHQTHRMGQPARVAEDLCRRVSLAQLADAFDGTQDAGKALLSLRKVQQDQHDYNDRNHTRSHRMHHKLESRVRLASKVVLLIIALDIVLLASKLACGSTLDAGTLAVLGGAGLVLVLCTALLPAVMATANALLFQTQAEQLSERERDLAETFKTHLAATATLQDDIAAGRVATPVAAAVLVEAERSAAVLAEEVAEWAVMSRQALKEV